MAIKMEVAMLVQSQFFCFSLRYIYHDPLPSRQILYIVAFVVQ